jgi:hypothetical protein
VHKFHARRKPQPQQKKLSTPKCYRCDGQGHYANECRFKEAICHKCNKKGHNKKACEITDMADPVSNSIGILTFSTHGLITIASFAFLLTLYIP